ncbi:MAG: hypothetical protein AAFY83_06845 [Pseudomonadota bacterium]
MRVILREALAPALALFTSASTLLCCALPALLVSVGAGALMAGLASSIPGYIWLTAHKGLLFGVGGSMLLAAVAARWATRHAPCPADPQQAMACGRLRRWGGVILTVAAIAYAIGGFFAFFAADLLP